MDNGTQQKYRRETMSSKDRPTIRLQTKPPGLDIKKTCCLLFSRGCERAVPTLIASINSSFCRRKCIRCSARLIKLSARIRGPSSRTNSGLNYWCISLLQSLAVRCFVGTIVPIQSQLGGANNGHVSNFPGEGCLVF